MLVEVIDAHLCLMLAGDQKQMIESHFADRQALPFDLLCVQRLALNTVAHGEAAVGAVVGAQVGKVKRDIEADGIAETLTRQALRLLRQRFKKVGGGGGEQRH